jgi:serine/threonine protein kinase/Tol biopolymer transport system component
MLLGVGEKLGPYEITGKLGAGGMGEVWKARDTRLDRTVAIKVSAEKFNARFEREARAVAALNHPNICQLYDVGPDYLVLEYVDGAPIASTESTRKLLDLAVQIADGMAAAHAAGLVHRDLKPNNVFVTREGRVKILDFGLAKNVAAPLDGMPAPTITGSGLVAGTAAYMSPEQVRGSADLDGRSDQFSFGLVLYEIAVGKRPFERESGVETLMAVLRDDPEPLPAKLPAPLRWIIERCLSKEPEQRYESSRDLFLELRTLRDHLADASQTHEAIAAGAAPRRRRWAPPAMFAAGSLLTAAAILLVGSREPPPAELKFTPLSFEQGGQGRPVWSPDSRAVAYAAQSRINNNLSDLYVRNLDSPVPTLLTSSAVPLQWTSGGQILFAGARLPAAFWSISPVGGEPEPKYAPDKRLVGSVPNSYAISRDGATIAMLMRHDDGMIGIGISSPSGAPTQRYEPAPFESPLFYNTPVLRFSPDGKQLLLMWNAGEGEQAWLMPFPPDAANAPRRVLESLPAFNGTPLFSWLPNNRHIVVSTTADSSPPQLYIANAESGAFRRFSGGTIAQGEPVVSPDGTKLVFQETAVDYDIVALDLATAAVTPMIATDRNELMPAWALDKPALVYLTDRNGDGEIWLHEPNRADSPVVKASDFSTPTQWLNAPLLSPDGRRLMYTRLDAGARLSRLWMSSVAGGGAPVPLMSKPTNSDPGSWSPDGLWYVYLAFDSSGQYALWKVRTTGTAEPEMITTGLQLRSPELPAVWSTSGDWILHENDGMKLIASDGKTTRDLKMGKAVCAFARDAERMYCIRIRGPDGLSFVEIDFEGTVVRVIGSVSPEYAPQSSLGSSLRLTLAPDGKSVTYSVATRSANLWLMDGLDTVALP